MQCFFKSSTLIGTFHTPEKQKRRSGTNVRFNCCSLSSENLFQLFVNWQLAVEFPLSSSADARDIPQIKNGKRAHLVSALCTSSPRENLLHP